MPRASKRETVAAKDLFLQAWSKTMNKAASAKEAGVAEKTAYQWLKEDNEFRASVERIRQNWVDSLEASLMNMLLKGKKKTIEKDKTTGKITVITEDPKVIIEMLARVAREPTLLAPEGWGEKKDVRVEMRVQMEESIRIYATQVVQVIRTEVSDERITRRIAQRIGAIRLTGDEPTAPPERASGDTEGKG